MTPGTTQRRAAGSEVSHPNNLKQMQPYPEFVVIVGSGRSGTGYLKTRLREALDIGFPAEEPKFVIPLYRRLRQFGDLSEHANLVRLVETLYHNSVRYGVFNNASRQPSAEEILERVREPTYTGALYATFEVAADIRGHSRFGYKDPMDLMNLDVLARLFPTGRFVHILRDGRDVALSYLRQNWGPTNLYSGIRYWSRKVKHGREAGAKLGERYFEIRLEDLVANTEEVVPHLVGFINGNPEEEQSQQLIDSINRTKKPNSTGRWQVKLSADERRLCEAAAGEMLRECGYETEFDAASVSPVAAAYYLGSDLASRLKNRGTRLQSRERAESPVQP